MHGRRLLPLLVVSLLAVGTPASAAPTTKKAMWGPSEVGGVSQFPIYRELGAGIWQTSVNWADVAPTRPQDPANPADPAYRWPADLDRSIVAAAANGIRVSVQLIGAPPWANGGHDSWSWAPTNPKDFATFAGAASRRWPAVRYWMIWGEPSREANFKPLVKETRGRKLTRAQAAAPRRYSQLLDASYAALKSAGAKDTVIGGNTFTTGDISPHNWILNMKLPNGKPPRFDQYGHNPFTGRRPDLRKPPLGNGFADFSDLDTLTGWIDKSLRRGAKRPRLFLSEFTLPTDNLNFEFNFFVSRAVQASWLRDALKITRTYSRVATLGWVTLYDDQPNAAGDQRNVGLIDASGTRKPAFAVFAAG